MKLPLQNMAIANEALVANGPAIRKVILSAITACRSDGECFYGSNRLLSIMCGTSTATAANHLHELQDKGIIKIENDAYGRRAVQLTDDGFYLVYTPLPAWVHDPKYHQGVVYGLNSNLG